MEQENLILDKLTEIANKLDEQNLLQKTVLNFNEACTYLDVSPSHLYKLTSTKHIPHFCHRVKNCTSGGKNWTPGYNVTDNPQPKNQKPPHRIY